MATKKVFIELINYLNEHKGKTVESILESADFKEIIEAKKNANTVIKDANGKVTHIFCYYHKQWEELKSVPYGKKASSHTGFNTMCKVGVNKWTKQQNDAKKAKGELLEKVAEGEVQPSDIAKQLESIENARNAIDMKDAPKGSKVEPKS